MTVPCGKCAGCLNYKSLKYTRMSQIESKCAKFTFFVTLTYNQESLPTVRVVSGERHEFNVIGKRTEMDVVHFELLDNDKLSKRYRSRLKNYYGLDKVQDFILQPNPHYV